MIQKIEELETELRHREERDERIRQSQHGRRGVGDLKQVPAHDPNPLPKRIRIVLSAKLMSSDPISDALFIRMSLSKVGEVATFGYARVSTRDQDLAGQLADLQAAGCGNIFKQKASKTDRPDLAKASRRLEPGDALIVTRLDRLARSTRDLLNILDAVGQAGAGFRSLKDAWADTTTPHGRLMLTVLGGLAEFERELIRARTDDGRKRAKARGVRFGRPPNVPAACQWRDRSGFA